MRVLILGCGYVGIALGRHLQAQGHEVFGLRRSVAGAAELASHGLPSLLGDVTDPSSLDALPRDFDWVANTVSSSRGDAEVYRQVYQQGTHHVLQWLRQTRCHRYVYTSSTSVYGQSDGSVVTEDAPTAPATETAQALVATEQDLQAAAATLPMAIGIFRVTGLYGPQRGHLYHQLLRGDARLQGDGSRLINMIHRDDAAAALAAFLTGSTAKGGARVYNATDDAPVTQREFFTWLSHRLNLPFPPPANAADGTLSKRGQTQQRVSNQRLRTELAWIPRYPTCREGYETLISGPQS